jgi:hypothetical protein
MDELWSFLRNKKNQLWVFVGFEVDSRFWMNFECQTAWKNGQGIRENSVENCPP